MTCEMHGIEGCACLDERTPCQLCTHERKRGRQIVALICFSACLTIVAWVWA